LTVKNKKKEGVKDFKESDLYKKLTKKDNKEIKGLFLDYLKKDSETIVGKFLAYIREEKVSIPDFIFNKKLTVLESIVKYLKENHSLSYREIAKSINRDERNIWHIYSSAVKKFSQKFIVKDSKFLIPLSVFSNRKLSILENLVFYLKNEFNLSYHKIAVVIHRDDRTVWTVYQKAKRKHDEK